VTLSKVGLGFVVNLIAVEPDEGFSVRSRDPNAAAWLKAPEALLEEEGRSCSR
jgi:hypothetical protein